MMTYDDVRAVITYDNRRLAVLDAVTVIPTDPREPVLQGEIVRFSAGPDEKLVVVRVVPDDIERHFAVSNVFKMGAGARERLTARKVMAYVAP